jgi:hypothetical protein
MASITAQILVGTSHPYQEGINPTHYLFLSENDRPAWILVRQNIKEDQRGGIGKITWIPTIENTLEDALLMVGIHVCESTELKTLAGTFSDKMEAEYLELYSDLTGSQREQLYQACRIIPEIPKVIISVFRGSALLRQFPVLVKYGMDIEVSSPI